MGKQLGAKKYTLILTEEQARLVAMCCEFYARIALGQFREITYHFMRGKPEGDWCERRDKAEALLFEARKCIYPELMGSGHSYGIGKFDDADQAYDVYQVIRKGLHPDAAPVFTYQPEIPVFKRLEEKREKA